MRILAIETSCDDTGIALLERTGQNQPKILANLVSSQIKIHAPWGGVVPMLAKREHQRNLIPIFQKTLAQAKLLKKKGSRLKNKEKIHKSKFKNLQSILRREPELLEKLISFLNEYEKPAIDALAVTAGPGLEPALWVGVNFARALAFFWNLPILAINHVEGHILTSFIGQKAPKNIFPAMGLIVSGGHTQLVLVKKNRSFRFKIVGETRDDAAGEAFDKVAKMLGLGYPGGPAIAAAATKLKMKNENLKIQLPRPMLNSGDFDFSFSGLKTAVLYTLQKMSPEEIKKSTPVIAAEFQKAVIDVLAAKTLKAARFYKAKSVVLSGGVASNDLLRETLRSLAKNKRLAFLTPQKEFCMDNAAMIGWAALTQNIKPQSWKTLKARANWRL